MLDVSSDGGTVESDRLVRSDGSGSVDGGGIGPDADGDLPGSAADGDANGRRAGRGVFRVDGVLEALGDPTRRVVVELLATGGGRTATSLAAGLPVTRQAVVQHLAVLREAGLVDSRREGREVRFELRSAALNETAAWMADVAAQWDRRLSVLAELAETAEVEAALERRRAVETES